MTTKYDNADWSKCAKTYEVTLVMMDDDGNAQGNEGLSLPCKGCYVQMREVVDTAKMSIGTPANALFGVELAPAGKKSSPLWVPVSDLSQLYFYGEPGVIVDIMYMLG